MNWATRSATSRTLFTHWCTQGREQSRCPKTESAQRHAVANMLARAPEADRLQFFANFRRGEMHTDLRRRTWAIMNEGNAA